MPIHNFPFTSIRTDDTPRTWLPIRIINPANGLIQNAYGLIDTGADECAIPASYASLLGHDLQSGKERKIKTGNGVTTAYSHTATLAILNFQGDHVVTIEEILIDFMPNLHIVLLGVKSFLSRFILTIHYPNQTFSIQWP
jgi:predicted aspartyl protease